MPWKLLGLSTSTMATARSYAARAAMVSHPRFKPCCSSRASGSWRFSTCGKCSIEAAASKATDKDLEAIGSACSRFDHLDDAGEDEVIAAILAFQRAVSAASHSSLLHSLEQFLLALLHEVQVKCLTGRGPSFWRARALNFQLHRMAILKGLKSGEPKIARQAMDRYFDAQRIRFEQDQNLCTLNLSSPGLIGVVADMVRQFSPSYSSL